MSTTCDIMELIKSHDTEFNMSTVMQCVQELKAWQESQQLKLCENTSMETLKDEMKDVLKSLDITKELQGASTIFIFNLTEICIIFILV